MIIVIAWVEARQRAVGLEHVRIDLGERVTFEEFKHPLSVVWLLDGTKEDVKKAEDYASTIENSKVFIFPKTEQAPLARAREMILKKGRV